MTNPRFSILIPVVKTRYFQEAFNSALGQDFGDYEIVVLDNKADADLSFVAKEGRVRFFKNDEQLPPAANWNKGIEFCRGEFILLLSDDDKLAANTLASVDAFLKKHDDDLDIIRILRAEFWESAPIHSYSCPGREVETVDEYIYYQLKFLRGQALSDIVFRRSATLELGGFRNVHASFGSDKMLAVELAARKNKIGNLNEVLLFYRWHAQNYTTVPRPSLYIDSLNSDFAFFEKCKGILNAGSGPFRDLALEANRVYFQGRQNGHYADALSFAGLRRFWRLYRETPQSEASRNKSVVAAILIWFRRKITKRY